MSKFDKFVKNQKKRMTAENSHQIQGILMSQSDINPIMKQGFQGAIHHLFKNKCPLSLAR